MWSLWKTFSIYSCKLFIIVSQALKATFIVLCWSGIKWGEVSVQVSCAYVIYGISSVSSVAQSCLTLCDPMDCSTPGFPVHHQLSEFTQTLVHWVGDAIQPSHPLSSPSPPTFSLSQHQGLFKWVDLSHQVAKVSEFQLQHQSFLWTPRTDVL